MKTTQKITLDPMRDMTMSYFFLFMALLALTTGFQWNGAGKPRIERLKQPGTLATTAAIIVSTILSCGIVPAALADPREPSQTDNQLVQQAFRDFDLKRFDDAEKEVTQALQIWKELDRPRDEIVSLLKVRANIKLDNKKFDASLSDCTEALKMMSNDGEKEDGTARYPEYPDTFVARGLAKEGLADWKGAYQQSLTYLYPHYFSLSSNQP